MPRVYSRDQSAAVAAIAERVSAIMDSRGLTTSEVSARSYRAGMPVSQSTVSAFLRGTLANPSFRILEGLAAGVGVPLEVLIGRTAEGYFHPIAFRTAAFLHEELTL